MKNTFFAMLSRMKYIARWGLMRSARQENLSEHTLEVAYLSHALTALGNRRYHRDLDPGLAVLYALYHDCAEIITGDLPTPVKYHSEALRAAYKELESEAAHRLLEKLPADLAEDFSPYFDIPPEYAPLVKAADKLSALIKCQEERGSGNHEFDSAFETTLASLRAMGLPEADDFLAEFFPAYGYTLDEQTGVPPVSRPARPLTGPHPGEGR